MPVMLVFQTCDPDLEGAEHILMKMMMLQRMSASASDPANSVGCAAVVVLITPSNILCANAGRSFPLGQWSTVRLEIEDQLTVEVCPRKQGDASISISIHTTSVKIV